MKLQMSKFQIWSFKRCFCIFQKQIEPYPFANSFIFMMTFVLFPTHPVNYTTNDSNEIYAHCTFMWAQRALDVKAYNGMKKKREKKNTNQIVISIEWNAHSNLTPGGMDFSHSIHSSEWRHHCGYNNLVKATLKWILLLHATPTASDTSIIILFIKWFHISHALFHYSMSHENVIFCTPNAQQTH